MSLTQPESKDNQAADLTLNLPSNNPFRNRAASPIPVSPGFSPRDSNPPPRPVSRNPFLDAPSSSNLTQAPINMSSTNGASTASAPLTGNAAELFDNLTLNDMNKPPSNGSRQGHPRSFADKNGSGSRSENIPPRGAPMHRPTRSQEEAMRARRAGAGGPGRPRAPNGELNIFADPDSPRKPADRRPRRNSESSVMERGSKAIDPEEEKKRQERRRRDRRHREGGKDSRSKGPNRKLDIIDQLDATSIYGTGLFHHDGPFDACNPHRNRQGSKRAPMQAFPKDSLNNILGGGGPLNKRPDHAAFLGHNDDEAFKDYAAGGSASYESYNSGSRALSKGPEPAVLSPLQRVEPIHGEETLGLGTSTFLEGAPASKNAIQRRETETSHQDNGLQRKKSLAQKIRGINNRRDFGPPGRVMSPDGMYTPSSPPPEYTSFTPGGTRSKVNERNPFFSEFETREEKLDLQTDDKKGESITIADPPNRPERDGAPGSPRRGFGGERLERRATSDGNGEDDKPTVGFLSRVKSLKGGRKPKVDRPV